jgi:hypothetical protein
MADAILGIIRDSDIHSGVGISHVRGCPLPLRISQSDEGGLAT